MRPTALDRVETARMVGERLAHKHISEFSALMRDPLVARTLWPTGTSPTEPEVLELLEWKIEHWDRYGFGHWLLRDRASAATVGRGGLQHALVEGLDEVEAGWAITPKRWGQGLATELALASIEVGFGQLGLTEIVAFTLPDNLASRRVMEKAGLAHEREIVHVGLPHVLYRRRP